MPTSWPTSRKYLRVVRRRLPPLNFITIHWLYFICTCMISAVIFWGASTPAQSVSFTDALFLVVSAMTLAGLNTVNLSTLNTSQQVMLFLLIFIGSAIFVSAFVVQVRKAAFEKRFRAVVSEKKKKPARERHESRSRLSLAGADESQQNGTQPLNDRGQSRERRDEDGKLRDEPSAHPISPVTEDSRAMSPAISFEPETYLDKVRSQRSIYLENESVFSMQGVGARPTASLDVIRTNRHDDSDTLRERKGHYSSSENVDDDSNEHFGGWIGRNSQFHGLTDKERERLGGYEYRAVQFLAWLVPVYFVLFQLLGCLGCASWIAVNQPSTAEENGLDPWWVGAFNAVSAFNNSGMSLLDANMVAYQQSVYLQMTMGFLILAGNTAYPLLLRLFVWCMYKTAFRLGRNSPLWSKRSETLRFLLDHPRRCYTNLFPAQHTWWLLLSVVTLNGVDWAAFEILNIGNDSIYTEVPSTGIRVLNGLFQALAVRSGGFYVVIITNLRISLQVLYVVMMYISVYPVVIGMRSSNVYEERSLGIYAEDEDERRKTRTSPQALGFMRTLTDHLVPERSNGKQSNGQFVRQQVRAQLAHDAWTIVLALFFIMIIEGSQFSEDPAVFSVFNFLFEIVSAYGCVGISVGIPTADYSFSGSWHVLSKLILCVVMLRGRHRGLPVAIDLAVLLPGDRTAAAEEDDGRIRRARSASRGARSEGA